MKKPPPKGWLVHAQHGRNTAVMDYGRLADMDSRLPPVEPPFLLDASLRLSEGLGASDYATAQARLVGILPIHYTTFR